MEMPRSIRILLLALVVVVLLTTLTALGLLTSRTPPRPPLPNPNGYDDFVKASETLTGRVSDFLELDHGSLEALVSANTESLRLVRLGLTRHCVPPMDFSQTNASAMMNRLGDMKRLVQLLAAEGRLREMDSRPADAAHSYTDAICFGNEMSRGGVLITRLVGVACESIGCHALSQIISKLSPDEARVVLIELEKVDAGHVTWAEVLRSERDYVRYQLRNRLNPILWVMSWWQTRQVMQRAETKHKIILAHERLLAAELALRCYQSENARVPLRLDDLVTNYLSRMPQDPFTSQPMIYRPKGTNWLLYSVGPDGLDDGGNAANRGWPIKGDILFDSPW